MSTSFSVTVPDIAATALQDWADSTGRTRGNLVGFLLEELARLKYPHRFTAPRLPNDINPDDYEALSKFVLKLTEGNLNASEVAMTARIVGIEPDSLQYRVDQSKNGDSTSQEPNR